MDSLNYHYDNNTNRLNHIDDSQTTQSAYTWDLEDQSPDNYTYDEIGNLISDARDSIDWITWTNNQKIYSIAKNDRTISFRYNPMQQRVAKYTKSNGSNAEKRTYYIRDAQGNVMATYSAFVQNNSGTITWDSLRLSEYHIYGSSRVGLALPNVKLYPYLPDSSHYPIFEGWKRYELSNHLGNVLAVITDRKHGKATSGTGIQWFDADVVSAQQYYPFGMLMPDTTDVELRRQYTVAGNDYRYGFNGKEGDDEVKGDDNQQDYGMRIYDPRVGRFLSVDPIAREYPWYTPYQFAGNMPIWAVDLDGLEPNKNPNGDNAMGEGGKRTITLIELKSNDNNLEANGSVLGMSDINGNIQNNYTQFYITDTESESADQFNMYVSTELTLKVDESNASEYKNYEAYIVAKLVSNFKEGTGPENYEFPENGIISNRFLKSDVLQKALEDFHNGEDVYNRQYEFGGLNLIKDIYRTGTMFSSITGFVGSATITIAQEESGIRIKLFNITSLTSGALGKEAGDVKDYPVSYVRNPNEKTPFGNISQTFNLFIPN